jgi:hypothetical protein
MNNRKGEQREIEMMMMMISMRMMMSTSIRVRLVMWAKRVLVDEERKKER